MANHHIKGLTVEIGGDTTELTAALKDIDKASKQSSDELKAVNAALKLDPTNTQMLAQKQDILAGSIDGAKKKLELLKKAEADAQKQFENGDIPAEQYRALQREVVYAENKLKKLEDQLEDVKNASDDVARAAKKQGDSTANAGKDGQEAANKNKKLSKSLEQLEADYKDAKDAAKDVGAEIAAGFTAAAAAVTASTAAAMSYEDALDSIAIQTGANQDQMLRFRQAADEVFASGLGEDMDDIASTMAVIAQQTHEADPDKLAELAENALILKDGFGFETAEQMRSVQMLVDTFGISAQQAYNLVVQGAQKGLNKNGDLLDVINEYSVHYKNLGYDAEGFFNSLANGTATGVFSVDKLGDAMKEFGIRVKDEASSTTEAFEALGLDAAQLRKLFAEGGKSAQQASKLVNDALFSMTDPITQNTVGVALYGTMWEDMGKEAIEAIGNVNGEISATHEAMEAVRQIKMDSTSAKWAQLGRTVQTELILPVGEELLPVAKHFFECCIDNSETLIPIAKTLGVVIASIFVVNKVAKFTQSMKTLITTFKALNAASTAGLGTMSAGLSTMSMILAKVAVVAAAVAAMFAPMIERTEQNSEALKQNQEELQKLSDRYTQAADSAKELAQAQKRAVNDMQADHKPFEKLVQELDTLVEANGRVKDGTQERVDYIANELNQAYGVEVEIVDGVVQKYDDLKQSIHEAMLERKAYDLLTSLSGDYSDAKATLAAGVDVAGSQAAYEEAAARYFALENIANDRSMSYDEKKKAMAEYGMDYVTWLEGGGKNATLYQMQTAQRAYEANKGVISRYDSLENAYYSQNYSGMEASITDMQNPAFRAGEYSYATLHEKQIEAYNAYQQLLEWSKRSGSSVTQEQIDEAADQLKFTTDQAVLQWLAEGRPEYASEDGSYGGTMQYNTKAAYNALGLDTETVLRDIFQSYFVNPEDALELFNGRSAYKQARVIGQSYATEGSSGGGGGNMFVLHAPAASPALRAPWAQFSAAVGGGSAVTDFALSPSADNRTAERQNELLEGILDRIDALEFNLYLDGDKVADKLLDRTDQKLGRRSADERRGKFRD